MRARCAAARAAVLLGTLVLLLAGCFPVPQIEEKLIELVTSSSVSGEFEAAGVTNVYTDELTLALDDSLDLQALLADAGIDPSEVLSITFTGASYQVLEPDTVSGRRIEDGQITVQRTGGAAAVLVADFDAPVEVTGYEMSLPLDAAGVAVIDTMLDDLLTAAKTGTQPANPVLDVAVSGISQPITQPSNFRWLIRLHVSIVGTIELDLVTF